MHVPLIEEACPISCWNGNISTYGDCMQRWYLNAEANKCKC
jgi:hypothetical protein